MTAAYDAGLKGLTVLIDERVYVTPPKAAADGMLKGRLLKPTPYCEYGELIPFWALTPNDRETSSINDMNPIYCFTSKLQK